MKSIITLLIAALIAASPAANSTKVKSTASVVKKTKASTVSPLVLLYTASARGQIRSCNCTKFRFGGYGRELTLLESIRKQSKNTILLEGGDITGGTGFQAELKADVAAKAMGLLGYGAMVPGEEELGIRGSSYINRFNAKSVPVLCANLYKLGSDKPIFQAYTFLKTSSGLRVGVIGLVDKSVGGALLEKQTGQTISDAGPVLKQLIKAVRAKSHLVVVVFHGPMQAAEKLAEINGVDLILATHRSVPDVTFAGKDTNIVEAPVKKIGRVVVADAGTRTNWSLGRLDLSLGKDGRIASVKHTLAYLDRRYNEDQRMVKVYDSYNEKVKLGVINSATKFKKDAEKLLAVRGIDVIHLRQQLRKSPFVTADKCKDCHSDIYENWSKTKHGSAIKTLEKAHQEYDPECMTCHTTGAIVRNGYKNQTETPELANVQCEACHGPGAEHAKDPKKGYGQVGEATCRSCHTDERTPDFDFNNEWIKIKH